MKSFDDVFYKEFKTDLFLMPVVTVLMFVCLTLPLSLPFIVIYPSVLAYVMVRRARDGYKILQGMGTYERVEANRLFDNRFSSVFLMLFTAPICLFNYLFVMSDTKLIQNWAEVALEKNEYFVDLLINYKVLKPALDAEIYSYASDPLHSAALYLFAVTFLMSLVILLSMFWISKWQSHTWKIRHDNLEGKGITQKQYAALKILLIAFVLLFCAYGYFFHSFDLGFYQLPDNEHYNFYPRRLYNDLLVHSAWIALFPMFASVILGLIQKLFMKET